MPKASLYPSTATFSTQHSRKIKLSLKSAKRPNFLGAFKKLRDEIIEEYDRHSYLWESDVLPKDERDKLKALSIEAKDSDLRDGEKRNEEIERYATALKSLSKALQMYHGVGTVVLLDEYDVPLENAYYEGFYQEMVGFIRSLFESVLKTNDALEFAVVMGCLRISKESIFTGLNHLDIYSIRSKGFEDAFGFTKEETRTIGAPQGHIGGRYRNNRNIRQWTFGKMYKYL